MGIFLRHSYNISPTCWGSFADIRYAIKTNAEKIFGVNADDIVLSLPLWEGSGDSVVDYVTQVRPAPDAYEAVWVDRRLYFDGANSRLKIFDAGALSGFSFFTVLASVQWKGTVRADEETVIGNWSQGATNRCFLFRWDSQTSAIEAYIAKSGGAINSANSYTNTDISDKRVHNLGLVYDGSHVIISKDGMASPTVSTLTGTLETAIGNVYVGTDKYPDAGPRDFFNGCLKNINILKNKITQAQISLFNDLPHGLYQKVSRPFYLLPAAAEHLLEESFEGAGYENSWSENLDSGCTLDEDSAIPGTPPTGSGSQCLKAITIDNVDRDARATHVFGYTDIVYTYAYIYIDEAIISEGEIFFSLATTTLAGSICASLLFGKDSSGNIICNLYYHSDGSAKHTSDFIIPLDSWSRFEYKYDKTNLAWEFRINGVNKGSGSLIDPLTPYRIELGVKSSTGYGSVTLYTDLFVLADDWVGEAPTIYPAWYYNMLKRRNA